MTTNEIQKKNIIDLYHRVASVYGQVEPNVNLAIGKRLVEHLGITEGMRVLDVAAGRGANLFPAAEKVGPGGQVIGIDLAAGMVQETSAEIQRRKLSNARMLSMDAEQLAFPDASFDAVLCGFAIFLFPHLEQALSEFFRVLRPGGKLGITVANTLDSLSRWYDQHLTEYHQRYHFPLHAGGGKGINYGQLPQYLSQIGFLSVEVLTEEMDAAYADAQQWWDSMWTHGTRYALEHMEPEVLEQFKVEVFERLGQEVQAGGIHERWRVLYILGSKGERQENTRL